MRLNNDLLPHQQEAVEKMRKLKVGALFMEQGTGKTITAIELARIRFEAGKIDRVVWLCPCSAKGNIKAEILKQCPEELSRIFVICGIETLSSSVRANEYLLNLTSRERCFLVVDESLLVKNHQTYRCKNITRISNMCPYKLILNGTPISKNEADLYAQFYILDWRILGYRSFWSFAANHLEYDDQGRLRRVLNADYLAHKISPYTFQIRKADCIKLPGKSYRSIGFYLTNEQNLEYERVAEILMMGIDEREPQTIYRLFSGLQAVISGKRLVFQGRRHFHTEEFFDNPMKNPRIQALLRNIPDEKTIIFCRFESEVSQLCEIIPDAVRFDGKVSMKNRNEALKQFSGEKKYLIANKNCAGFSLNLQFCHNIIFLSNDWELGKRLQSEDRVHRLGQNCKVNITDIFAYNTLDERILNCLSRKEGILDSIKKEIDMAKMDFKSGIREIIYGKNKRRTVVDLSELGDDDAENL
ncbi:MAG TPA: DEAD/DEAH box helicase [Candidatus Caccovicinus merdipullorum]|uniref:DEAD/DEAH box helicase n=1 Tax=Candidatus Caccovicinus merdipullorum TaxID=2840724 RepID=A0A9D1GLD4_9FIRM|nr:DEAD/DEAH box helicase [Candidatus Caccovicinus merdipullorum]